MLLAQAIMSNDPVFKNSQLARYCVANYLSEDVLINAVHFVPVNQIVQSGPLAFQYRYSIENIDAAGVAFRKIGEEYPVGNNYGSEATAKMAILGGNFSVDEEFQFVTAPGTGSLENYVDGQMRKKAVALTKAFNQYTIKGDASDGKSFNGLEKLVPASRTKTDIINLGDYSGEKLRIAWTTLYSVLDAVPGANLIITTMEGVSAFRALLGTKNLSLSSSEIATLASMQNQAPALPCIRFENMLVIGLPRAYFTASELVNKEPFYVLRSDSSTGFKFVTPAGRPVVYAKVPNLTNADSTQHQGGLSMHCAPVIEDLYACAKGYISAGNASVASLNNATPYTVEKSLITDANNDGEADGESDAP